MPDINKDDVVKNQEISEQQNGEQSVEVPMGSAYERELAEMVASLNEEELKEFNKKVDKGEIACEFSEVVETEEKDKKIPIAPVPVVIDNDEEKTVQNTENDPEGATSQMVDLADGQLDKEEKYIKENMHDGTYIDQREVAAIASRYQRTVSDAQKSGSNVEQKLKNAEAVWQKEMDTLIAKANPYDKAEIRKRQFEAGSKGQALVYYHKDKNGELISTMVSPDRTKQYYRDLINTHKERVGENEKGAKNQESKLGSNAATFARGDAESMSHGTMYMSVNALLWLAQKAIAQGHKFSADFEEFIAKQGINFEELNKDKKEKGDEEPVEQIESKNNEEGLEMDDGNEEPSQEQPSPEETKEVKVEPNKDDVGKNGEDVESILSSMDPDNKSIESKETDKISEQVEEQVVEVEDEDDYDLTEKESNEDKREDVQDILNDNKSKKSKDEKGDDDVFSRNGGLEAINSNKSSVKPISSDLGKEAEEDISNALEELSDI